MFSLFGAVNCFCSLNIRIWNPEQCGLNVQCISSICEGSCSLIRVRGTEVDLRLKIKRNQSETSFRECLKIFFNACCMLYHTAIQALKYMFDICQDIRVVLKAATFILKDGPSHMA